jgi:hypothetical protein
VEASVTRPADQDHHCLAVATVAAAISYGHAYELIATHGKTGATARLVPFTVGRAHPGREPDLT